MKIDLHEITIRDLFDGFTEDDANGIVTGYHGQLNMRPVYQLPDISHKRDIKCLCILSMSMYHNCDIIKT